MHWTCVGGHKGEQDAAPVASVLTVLWETRHTQPRITQRGECPTNFIDQLTKCCGDIDITPKNPGVFQVFCFVLFCQQITLIYRVNEGWERPPGFSQGSEKSSNLMLSPLEPVSHPGFAETGEDGDHLSHCGTL